MDEKIIPHYELPSFDDIGTFQPKQKNKKVIIGIIIGIVAVLAIFTGVLAARIWDPLWNPFRPAPEIVLAKATKNFFDLKSLHSDVFFNVDFENDETARVSVQISSDSDNFDEETPKSHARFDVSLGAKGATFLIGGEAITIRDEQYFKIDTLPAPLVASLGMFGLNLDEFKDKWISFSPKDFGMAIGFQALTPEERKELEQKFQELVFKYPVVKVKKELPDEVINDRKMYHFLATLDKENIKLYLAEVIKLIKDYGLIPETSGQETLFGEKEILELNQAIDKLFEKTGEINTEIFVDKIDYLVYEIKGMKTIENLDLSDIEGQATQTNPGKAVIKWTFKFSQFNQPMNIQAPEEAKSFMDLLMNLMGTFIYSQQGTGLPTNQSFELPAIPLQ
ncbi:hypothetical protein J7L09_01120 [bacterium]|nr:hypothetical protein [bacterium]